MQSVVKDPEAADADVGNNNSVSNQPSQILGSCHQGSQAKANTGAGGSRSYWTLLIQTRRRPQSIANYQQALDSLRNSLEATRAQAQAMWLIRAKQERIRLKALVAVNGGRLNSIKLKLCYDNKRISPP